MKNYKILKILDDIACSILFFGVIGFSLYFHRLDSLIFFVIGFSVGGWIGIRN